MEKFNTVVIGGGPAGLAAAIKASSSKVLLIEREARLGGILKQCIHDGFGVVRFGEKLSGPEYADRFIKQLKETNVQVSLFSFVTRMVKEGNLYHITYVCKDGVKNVECERIVLATGCRERTRNGVLIHGDRCAGVYTAGTAQNLVNVLGVMPGKNVVILGSGDIGLIMARRLTLEGAHVEGVYEAKPTPSGLSRNIYQCLNDFDIPLHLSATVTRVFGKTRLERVEISDVDEQMRPISGTERIVECDCLVLAVGLIPENELARELNVPIDPKTKGAIVDQNCQTLVDGIYACGNALHVNDLVDYVSESGEIAGEHCAEPVKTRNLREVNTQGKLLYVVPQRIDANSTLNKVVMYFRASDVLTNQRLTVEANGQTMFSKTYAKLLPPEMERITVDLTNADLTNGVTVKLEGK